jgi:hypothetical protein
MRVSRAHSILVPQTSAANDIHRRVRLVIKKTHPIKGGLNDNYFSHEKNFTEPKVATSECRFSSLAGNFH